MIIVGLIVLLAAVIVGVAGVLGNAGGDASLTHGFSVFGYHVTGSTGTLFLYGIVVGALAVLGLGLLLAGARHTSRRGRAARKELKTSRRETALVSQDRDDLIDQRDSARSEEPALTPGGTSCVRRWRRTQSGQRSLAFPGPTRVAGRRRRRRMTVGRSAP